jgi:hypothetical protein
LNDVFEQDYEQDDENRTMGLVQRNTGKREQLILSLNAPLKVAGWYGLNFYSQAAYMMIDTRHSGEKFQKNYLTAYAGLNHNFTFSPSFRANMQMTWTKPGYVGIIKMYDDIWGVNARIEKTFLDNRLSLSLSCDDIFSTTDVSRGKMKIGNIDQSIKQDMYRRQIMFTVRYGFGSQKIRGARNRNVGIEDEMSRTK